MSGFKAQFAQRPCGLRSTRDLADPRQLRQKRGLQRRLMLLDAAEQPAQSLSGEHNEIIAGPFGETADEGHNGCGIGRIADGHQRAAQHLRATPLEQCGKYIQLTRFGYGDGPAVQSLGFH